METETLKKQLQEKIELRARTEIVFHQLNGQIGLLESLIKEAETKNKSEDKPKE